MKIIKTGKNKVFPIRVKCSVCRSVLSVEDEDLTLTGLYKDFFYATCPVCSNSVFIEGNQIVNEIKAYRRTKSLNGEIIKKEKKEIEK